MEDSRKIELILKIIDAVEIVHSNASSNSNKDKWIANGANNACSSIKDWIERIEENKFEEYLEDWKSTYGGEKWR